MRGLPTRALMPLPRGLSMALCVGILVAIALVDRAVIPLMAVAPHPRALALGVALDLTVVSALLAWWMLRQELGWGPGALVPLFLASLLSARLALPDDYEAVLRPMQLLAAPVELVVLVWIGLKLRDGRRAWSASGSTLDAGDRVDLAAREVLGAGRLAAVFATELTVLRYALLSWRDSAPSGEDTLTYDRRTSYGAILVALLLVSAAEIPALHLMVSLWSDTAAWLLTGLGAYGVLWIVGDWRACRLRPVRVDGDILRIRFGLRWRVDVPMEHLRQVRAPTGTERSDRSAVDLRLALPGASWQLLELDRPVTAVGMYGLQRQVRTLGLGLDAPERLMTALETYRAARPGPPSEHSHDERT